MVEVESFLKGADGTFTAVQECVAPPGDPQYIEGCIRLVVNGTEVMGFEEWDLVDQLWTYLADLATESKGTGGRVSTTFPDQPLEFSLERTGNRTLVTCGERKAQAATGELLQALGAAGALFFAHLERLLPAEAHWYTAYRARLDAL